MDHRRGVSLIELMVTLAIIAIAAGVVAPSIGSSYERLRLRSFSREIASEIRAARSAAQTDGRLWSIALGENDGHVWAGGSLGRNIAYPDGIRVASGPGDVLLLFLPSGQVTGSRTIRLTNQSGQTAELDVDGLSSRVIARTEVQ